MMTPIQIVTTAARDIQSCVRIVVFFAGRTYPERPNPLLPTFQSPHEKSSANENLVVFTCGIQFRLRN
jgi:hypothetical protein